MGWGRFWNWVMKDEEVDQPPSVRMALGNFHQRRNDGRDGR
jgi:hypothetical protein